MSGENKKEWLLAQKRPLIIEFRKVRGESEVLTTCDGAKIEVFALRHLVMRDEAGEYPILGTVFAKTYDVLPDWLQKWRTTEPFWKSDLVGRIWAYARANGLLIVDSARDDAGRERLPPGLGDLVGEIRQRCDRCGVTPKQAQIAEGSGSRMNPITDYQCCRIHSLAEEYTPKLCPSCHHEQMRIFPHSVISV